MFHSRCLGMKYKCIIVDDEPLAQKILKTYVSQFGNFELTGVFNNASDARKFINSSPPDVMLLDIQMPEETGIQLIQSLRKKPITIFTTAHINYSLEGFELGVIDYLVKPIRYSRFETAFRRSLEMLELLSMQSLINQNLNEEIYIKSGTKKYMLKRKTISHVQAWKDYVIIFCEHKKYVVRATIKQMELMLGAENFVRVHKSFLVSKEALKYYSNMKITFADYEIPVGRKYKNNADIYTEPSGNKFL